MITGYRVFLSTQSAMWITALDEFPPFWKRLLIALSKVGLITHLTAEAQGKGSRQQGAGEGDLRDLVSGAK